MSLKNVSAGSPSFFHANIIIVYLSCKYRKEWSRTILGKGTHQMDIERILSQPLRSRRTVINIIKVRYG